MHRRDISMNSLMMRSQLVISAALLVSLLLPAASASANTGDFTGGVAIGSSYAGVDTAPSNGLIVQGALGVGTASPVNAFDLSGAAVIGSGYAGVDTAPTNGLLVQGAAALGTTTTQTGYELTVSGGSYSTQSSSSYAAVSGSNTAAGGAGYGGYFSASTTGVGYGVYSAITGSANTGYAGFFTNTGTGTTNYAVYASTSSASGIAVDSNGILNVEGDGFLRMTNEGSNSVGASSDYWIGRGGEFGTSGGTMAFNAPSGTGTGFEWAIANTSYMAMNSSGKVQIGVGSLRPTHNLDVGGSSVSGAVLGLIGSSGTCTHTPGSSSETVSCSSDIRLKSDIKDARSALAWLKDMRIRDFTLKATGERKTGVVAQEMLLEHGDMVHKENDDFYTVDEPSPWKLVKAIQEQQAEIEDLRAQLVALKSGATTK